MQIAWCLAHYYGHVTALGSRLIQASRPGAVQTPAQAAQVQAAQGPPDPGRATTPVPRLPRTKGLTGKVNAARHRAVVPGGATDLARPLSGELDLFAPEAAAAPAPAGAEVTPAGAEATPAPAPAPARCPGAAPTTTACPTSPARAASPARSASRRACAPPRSSRRCRIRTATRTTTTSR